MRTRDDTNPLARARGARTDADHGLPRDDWSGRKATGGGSVRIHAPMDYHSIRTSSKGGKPVDTGCGMPVIGRPVPAL